MKLSIIVPVYNMAAGNKLNFCMDSLLKQTISDYEIIAVDDKSTDESAFILQEYQKKHPDKVKVILSEENRRQGGAKNLGLVQACGEWLGFIDSDDWITPDMYEKLLKKAEETGADVVGCDYSITEQQDFTVGEICRINDKDETGVMGEEQYQKVILKPGSMVIKIYKRDIFEENGLWFPENTFYEDNCLGPLTMLYCKHFERVDEPLYFYFQHQASTVHSISVDRCNDRLKTMLMFVGECQKRGFLEDYYDEIEYRFTELFYINTLFTYMIGVKHKKLSYLNDLKWGIKINFPEFIENPYYLMRQDAEVQKLVRLHMKSSFLFYWYYMLLHLYRRIRYGKK